MSGAASSAAVLREDGKLAGRKKGIEQPKDRCPGCGTMVTRGRPGKRHIPDLDGKRPCEQETLRRAGEASTKPVDKTPTPTDYSFGSYEDLDDLEKAAAGDPNDPGDISPPPAPPSGPGGALAPAQISGEDLALLLPPDILWGAAADIANSRIKHEKNKIEMNHAKAMRLHGALARVIPVILTTPWGAFAITMGMVFLAPIGLDWWETNREKKAAAAAAKAAAAAEAPAAATPK